MKYDINEIKKYNVVGIRGLASDEKYEIGDVCRNSFDWDYENDMSSYGTENEIDLGGTCAVHVVFDKDWDSDEEIEKAIENVLNDFIYSGEIVIIAGESFEYGADENEVIVEDAIVIAK